MMIRKQILIPEEMEQRLAIAKETLNKSEAQIIREFIDAGLKRSHPERSAGEALLGLAELGKRFGISGPPDLSEQHDAYLYGDKA